MYRIFNTDNCTAQQINKDQIYSTLAKLIRQGALVSLDIDNDICYSFEDEWEQEPIESIIKRARIFY